MISFPGPLGRWELVGGARRPWVYVARIVYALILLFALGFGWPQGAVSNAEASQAGYHLSRTLLLIHAGVVVLGTPLWVADVFAGARRVGRLDLLFATHLRDEEIVFGSLVGRLAGLALLSFGGLPAVALTGLLGGLDYNLLFTTFWLTGLTLAYCGSLAIYYSVVAADTGRALTRTYLRLLVLTCIPGGSPLWLWTPALAGLPLPLTNVAVWWSIVLCCICIAVYLANAVNYLRVPHARRTRGLFSDLDQQDPTQRVFAQIAIKFLAMMGGLSCGFPLLYICITAVARAQEAAGLAILTNVVYLLVCFIALHLAIRAACLNGWMDRRGGQADLVLATSMGNWEFLDRIVVRGRPMRTAWYVARGAGLILLFSVLACPAPIQGLLASIAAVVVSFSLAAYAAAVGTLMMMCRLRPRAAQAATWGVVAATCLLPLFAMFAAFWYWAAAVMVFIVAASSRSRAPIVQAAASLGLFVTVSYVIAIAQQFPEFKLEAAGTTSPALWIVKSLEMRATSGLNSVLWPALTSTLHEASLAAVRLHRQWLHTLAGTVPGSLFAAGAVWLYVWLQFDWLVDRPRLKRRTASQEIVTPERG